MNNPSYKISKDAASDLEEIWIYTAKRWSIEQADRYYKLIFDEINYLIKNSQSGKPLDSVRKGYRASKVKSHIIFYKINNNIIEIIRILHERMDLDAHLVD